MARRRHSDVTEETMRIIDRLSFNKSQGAQLRRDLLSQGGVAKPAEEFTLDEVVQVFKLNYTATNPFNAEQHIWKIEDSDLDFTMTPYLTSLLDNYAKNFVRSSKAVCRIALNLILNECLAVTKRDHVNPAAETTGDHKKRIPGRFDDLQVYGDVAFNHEVTPQLETSQKRLLVIGRLCGIGRVVYRLAERRFQCFLVIVTAKESSVRLAVPELLAYLACLRQSRLERNRADASVCGIASDGYQFVFATVTHDSTVKISAEFDIRQDNLVKVLGWLRFILEKTVTMNPNVSGGDENDEGEFDDPPIDLGDNDYTNLPKEEDYYL